MTREQFTKLPFTQQCLLMQHLAVEVANSKDQDYRYYLYQLDSFYVEAKVQLYEDRLVEMFSFPPNNKLNRYLEVIDISEVFD